MTPAGKCINPNNPAAFTVYIDGVQRTLIPGTNWFAGLNRPDLAAAYPGLCNSSNALAVYYINASALGLAAGLHTISWDVMDEAGKVAAGIGSRFFNVVAP